MFTGIISAVGSVASLTRSGDDARIVLRAGKLSMQDVSLGDSIAVNGVCLTVIEKDKTSFAADVSVETLSRTTLGELSKANKVNLEKALLPSMRLGGHFVSGHVDGVGVIVERKSDARSERFLIMSPDNLSKYIAEKGSICIDGISLTVNSVDGNKFDVNIVPHTLAHTTMGNFNVGQKVNVEVDLIARYLERLMEGDKAADVDQKSDGISESFLAEHGFK
jgi:riboflavin synthase